MTAFVERSVPKAALTTIAQGLRGGHGLARQIAAEHDIRRWDARTFCPDRVSSEQLLAIDTSLGVSTGPAFEWLKQELRTFLLSNARTSVVFEDALGRRGDPGLRMIAAPCRYLGSEVYGVIGPDAATNDRVAEAVRDFDNGTGFLAAMVELAAADIGGLDEEFTNEQIAAAARSTTAIVVTAYDGDSYIICRKT